MQPLVSAIITTHNRLSLLKRSCDSVLNQTYPKIELIIVDDASTDMTQKWSTYLEKYFPKGEKSVKYIHIPPEESKGGNYARNLGIKNSHGEYVAFLDDDDVWLPEKIERQVEAFSKYDCGVVFGEGIIETINKKGESSMRLFKSHPEITGNLSKIILSHIVTSTSFIMVKKDLLFKVGLFDENLRFWQEYELLIRLAQISNFQRLNSTIAVYRINSRDKNRLTNKYKEWRKTVDYIHNKHKNLYSQLSFNEKLRTKALVWGDACVRSHNAGLKWVWLWNKSLLTIWRVYNLFTSGHPLKKIKNRLK